MKLVQVIVLYKKVQGMSNDYRPISLSIFDKIFEKIYICKDLFLS